MARRTKEDAAATRQQILDSAERVFAAKGLAHSTMADIAADAGVSRGAVYWHFDSKNAVFQAILDRDYDAKRLVCARSQAPQESDPLGRIREILVHFLQRVVEDPQQRRVSEILAHKCELAGELEDLRRLLQETHAESLQGIALSLSNAVQRGHLPADLHLQRAAFALHAYMHGLIDNWLLHPDSYPLAEESEALVDALLGMLRYSPALRRPPA